jgi:cation transport ATPase
VKPVGRISKTQSTAPVTINWSTKVLRLRDEDLFGERLGELCAVFLRRIFSLREVKSVEINRAEFTAEICFDGNHAKLPEHLQRLAGAIRGETAQQPEPISDCPILEDLLDARGQFKIWRLDTVLTIWNIVDSQPGRIRLRHDSIRRDPALAARVQRIVEDTAGVIACSVHLLTGSVLIRFDPATTSAAQLLQILERERQKPALPDLDGSTPMPPRYGVSTTSLALATAGELAVPALLPACAVLLLGSNLGTFRAAAQQLLQRRIGLAALYTSIVVATLASGQFIASAGMSWMFVFWRRRYHNQLKNSCQRFLGKITMLPSCARLARTETTASNIETLTDDLIPGHVILISAGEQIPADGRVVRGHGLVDEQLICGIRGLSRKGPEDSVLAGSSLCHGELHIEVAQKGARTQAALLAQAISAVTAPVSGSHAVTLRGEKLAERAVIPAMAAAGAGLLLGGLNTAGAILRPDYATGPGLAFPLETLQAVTLCLRHGIVVRTPEAIERVATSNLLIIDHSPVLERTELEIAAIEAFPGTTEDDLLRFADAAFRDLDDERASVLHRICRRREIQPLDVQPVEFATDVTLLCGSDRIKVGDLGARSTKVFKATRSENADRQESRSADSLMIGINGRVAGLIHFRYSNRLEAASAIQRLKSKRDLQIGIVSQQSDPTLAPITRSLGADFHIGDLTPSDRNHLLKDCRDHGFKVAYVGDFTHDPHISGEVHVTISLVTDAKHGLDRGPAAVQLLQPRLSRLPELWDIAHIHERRLKMAYGYALIPNLLCVAGAFMWGFTSLASVVLTNLGTSGLYLRTANSIRSLDHQISHSFNLR